MHTHTAILTVITRDHAIFAAEESMKFFEGDIALKPGTEDPIEQVGAVRAKRESVIHDKSHATGDSDFISQDGYKTREDLWPDGKVPYKFEEGLSKCMQAMVANS